MVTERKPKINVWQRLAEPLGRFPLNFYASVHGSPTVILQVSSKAIRVWGSNQKPFCDPQSDSRLQ